jgi:uncharacterized protein (TIGR02757 family)
MTRRKLEALYARFNRRELVHPDPVELLYAYDDPADREIAALVASSLAYGRVRLILASASSVLERMGSPARFVRSSAPSKLKRAFLGFRHRFAGEENLVSLLLGARRTLGEFGSLEKCFMAGVGEDDETVMPALEAFAGRIIEGPGKECGHLIPRPGGKSACKRLNLMLRWLVREDEVDPGGWSGIPASKLVVPLDTHMHRIGLALGLTARKTSDCKAALEMTAALARFCPEDPVRYDFGLAHLGIRGEFTGTGSGPAF